MKKNEVIEEMSLALQGKDRDYFMERGIPFPVYWYGYGELPKNRKKSRAYSQEMRNLSDMSLDQLTVIGMFWGIDKFDKNLVMSMDRDFVENIPVPTPTRFNALTQIKFSMISSEERKEWADRVEGKPVSREVSMSLNTNDEESSTSSARELIMSKFDELTNYWEDYGKEETKELSYEDKLLLGDSSNG